MVPCTHANTSMRPLRPPPPRPGAVLSVDDVQRLHPGVECPAWQTVMELVDMGVVEARVDRAGFVRLYPMGVPA